MNNTHEVLIIVLSSLGLMAIVALLTRRFVNKRPLTSVLYFMADKQRPVLHILGYERIIPEDGDSFDVYKHYLFHLHTGKFELLAKQRGTGIDLQSEFVKRSLSAYASKHGVQLEFGIRALKNKFTHLYSRNSSDPVFEIYHEDSRRSDTELPPQFSPNALLFTRYTEHGVGMFTLTIRINGQTTHTCKMNGAPDQDCFGFYDNNRKRLYLVYLRSKLVAVGTGFMVIDYAEGKLVSDEFVR
ncbi:MAG: hypothetical protein IM638_01615 [Bacteroidetes bacterium]|nr:hypothetical protein [Bacteroidota bacterium]